MIALDIETTGLDCSTDTILEFGAVKFKGKEIIDTFSQIVNPVRTLSPFITALTGITQQEADNAPVWEEVHTSVAEFIEDIPIVGHNVKFDIGFMQTHNLQIPSEFYDTYELALSMLPNAQSYSLTALIEEFGLVNTQPHRALSDATAAMNLFVALLDKVTQFGSAFIKQILTIGSPTWQMGSIARQILQQYTQEKSNQIPNTQIHSLNPAAIAARIGGRRSTVSDTGSIKEALPLSLLDSVEDVFLGDGPLKSRFNAYEIRTGQYKMADAVAKALKNRENLVVEAGTGIGKSLAYLIPSLIYAKCSQKPRPVLISTNTVNLQQQLMKKDADIAVHAVTRFTNRTDFYYTQIFGRANYLCYHRFANSIAEGGIDDQDANLLLKCLIWLEESKDPIDGVRTGLNLTRRENAIFTRFSAESATTCLYGSPSACFYRKAKKEASQADIIFINHALLIADKLNSNNILPPHSALIIDEAHHLIDAAASGFSFDINQIEIVELISSFANESGYVGNLVNQLSNKPLPQHSKNRLYELNAQLVDNAQIAIDYTKTFFNAVSYNVKVSDIRISKELMRDNYWQNIKIMFTTLKQALDNTITTTEELLEELNDISLTPGLLNIDSKTSDITENIVKSLSTLRQYTGWLNTTIVEPDDNYVYWVSKKGKEVSIHGTPIDVSHYLKELLFNDNTPVVLTGATIVQNGDFGKYTSAVGIDNSVNIQIDSPFDYERASLVLIASDIPPIGSISYPKIQVEGILQTVRACKGRILVLFTSHTALRQAYSALENELKNTDVKLLGQNITGPPTRVMQLLYKYKRSVALGAASFWEGIDSANVSFDAIVIAKLPFPVPSDPVVAARSERVNDSFRDYLLPKAVQRFRQGFGLLIRSKENCGVFVVLDSRVLQKEYGRDFMRSLPKCPKKKLPVARLQEYITGWLYPPGN